MTTWELEYTKGSSNKFYRIGLDGTRVTLHWGRIGTAGQTDVRKLSTESQATAFASDKLNEKLKKGYILVHQEHHTKFTGPFADTLEIMAQA